MAYFLHRVASALLMALAGLPATLVVATLGPEIYDLERFVSV